MNELRVIDEVRDGSVVEFSFTVQRDGQDVPCVLWRPDSGSATSVVMLGHGGSGHKRSERNVRLATWFAECAGIASLAIDGPFHGDRVVAGDGPLDYQDRIADEGAETIHHRMCQDWLAALSAVDDARWVGGPSIAFLGMSMGARYGLPVCAALAPRLRCAIFGKFGLTQTARLPEALAANDVVTAAAETIRAPILQHVQWHDEIFPRTGQLELFELFPSPDKLLRGRPGSHALTHPDDEIAWREYVTAHLNHP